ncbi:ATP-binding protein [Neobacillus niacini]|jgi:PAS domain S-box-containing protein|uniref:ATP-binding protein n=1 Tax=Neobacillus niacini TaxID=86668 RepID=UPI001C8CFE7C|nr:ATP-binding protein [Neobacillus niacini]MBY0147258.1 PAS domain-containing protein [Neobacillus niacini]
MKKTKLVFLYLISSFLWIYISNYVITHYIPSSYDYYVERGKEIFYIFVTGAIFYFLILNKEELNNTKEQEKRLSTLINSMVDFVNFKDGDGRWIQSNEFGLKLFQLENVDYRGKKDSELAQYTDFYAEALQNCEVSDEETWERGTITRCEEVVPLPDGTSKIFDTIKVPLFHEDGSREGLVIIGRDITTLRQTEERLSRSEKLSVVGELSASVAHEIRNPLTSLKGFVQLLQMEDDKHQDYYQIMLDELNRINHIVGELLLLAKPQHLQYSKQAIQKILKDVISLLGVEATLYNVQIESNFPKEDLIIECEPNQLKQLFINLIKNSIEASKNGGTIWISLKQIEDNQVSITVKDNGSGISRERLEKIGEPFYSSKEKGTGLGLTVSFKIVQSHKGTIHFDSEIDLGTTVDIILPIEQNLSIKTTN